mgnify:CR=1 FL=1
MLGGRFDEHPWGSDGIADATVVVDDHAVPGDEGASRSAWSMHDEHYQLKDFSRDKVHVLRAPRHRVSVDLDAAARPSDRWRLPGRVGRRPTAKGRVFYSTLGHAAESWDNPLIQSILPRGASLGDETLRLGKGMMRRVRFGATVAAAGAAGRDGGGRTGSARPGRAWGRRRAPRVRTRKVVLAWADTRNGIAQHDSDVARARRHRASRLRVRRVRHLHPHRFEHRRRSSR